MILRDLCKVMNEWVDVYNIDESYTVPIFDEQIELTSTNKQLEPYLDYQVCHIETTCRRDEYTELHIWICR